MVGGPEPSSASSHRLVLVLSLGLSGSRNLGCRDPGKPLLGSVSLHQPLSLLWVTSEFTWTLLFQASSSCFNFLLYPEIMCGRHFGIKIARISAVLSSSRAGSVEPGCFPCLGCQEPGLKSQPCHTQALPRTTSSAFTHLSEPVCLLSCN